MMASMKPQNIRDISIAGYGRDFDVDLEFKDVNVFLNLAFEFFKVIIFFVKQPTWLVLIFSLFSSASFIHSQEIEEVVITGSLLKALN